MKPKSTIQTRNKKAYYLRRFKDTLKYYTQPLYRQSPLIIYQMGKVGSSTMERSLSTYSLNRPVFRAHALVKKHMQQGRKALGLSAAQYYARSNLEAKSYYLAKEIVRAKKQQKGEWKFITMVRDPVAQNISSFFQLIDVIIPDFAQRAASQDIAIDELRELFLQRYSPDCIYNQWFDQELKPVLGLDVYQSEFNPQQGYSIYRQGCIELLLIRLESINACANEAFSDFLNIKDFHILNANTAENKPYSTLYRQFKSEAELPESYLSGVYNGKQARHFYTEAELSAFKSSYRTAIWL